MSKSYKKAMERIEVTEDMRQKILERLQEEEMRTEESASVQDFCQKGKKRPFKRVYLGYIAAACLLCIGIGGVVTPVLLHRLQSPPEMQGGYEVEEAASVEELSELVSFQVQELGALAEEADSTVYLSYWGDMAEIVYYENEQTATYRMAKGSEDISGDYNEYAVSEIEQMGETSVTLKGNKDGYTLMIWSKDGYSYSLSLEKPVEKTQILDMLQPVC